MVDTELGKGEEECVLEYAAGGGLSGGRVGAVDGLRGGVGLWGDRMRMDLRVYRGGGGAYSICTTRAQVCTFMACSRFQNSGPEPISIDI